MNCQQRQLNFLRKGRSCLSRRDHCHLKNCPECRQFIADLAKLEPRLKELSLAEPERRLDATVRDQVRRSFPREGQSPCTWSLRRVLPTAALAGIAVVGLALWWTSHTSTPETKPDPASPPLAEKSVKELEVIFSEAILEAEIEVRASLAEKSPQHESSAEKIVPLNYLEEELWVLEAEMQAEHLDMQKKPELWYAEVD